MKSLTSLLCATALIGVYLATSSVSAVPAFTDYRRPPWPVPPPVPPVPAPLPPWWTDPERESIAQPEFNGAINVPMMTWPWHVADSPYVETNPDVPAEDSPNCAAGGWMNTMAYFEPTLQLTSPTGTFGNNALLGPLPVEYSYMSGGMPATTQVTSWIDVLRDRPAHDGFPDRAGIWSAAILPPVTNGSSVQEVTAAAANINREWFNNSTTLTATGLHIWDQEGGPVTRDAFQMINDGFGERSISMVLLNYQFANGQTGGHWVTASGTLSNSLSADQVLYASDPNAYNSHTTYSPIDDYTGFTLVDRAFGLGNLRMRFDLQSDGSYRSLDPYTVVNPATDQDEEVVPTIVAVVTVRLIPAPGAITLLSAAGLMLFTSRRRDA